MLYSIYVGEVMTEFEEKIKDYLRVANKRFQNTKSRKLAAIYFDDIDILLSIVQNNELDIDVDSIFKYTDFNLKLDAFDDKYNQYFLHNYENCKKVNNRVGELGVYLDNIYGEGYNKNFKTPMNMNESVLLCQKFFDFYDKDVSDYFKHIVEKGNLYIGGYSGDMNTSGCTFSLLSQDDPFILINHYESVFLADVMVHEVIHSYIEHAFNDKSFEKICTKLSNGLDEVYSRFIELVFCLYLEETHFNQNDIDSLGLTFDNTLIEVLYKYNYLLKKCDSNTLLTNFELCNEFIEDEMYSYGGVLAYHYFDEYLRNPERCKDNITNFSLDTKNHDREYMLNNYGLKEDNLGKSRVLVKHMKNHFKY